MFRYRLLVVLLLSTVAIVPLAHNHPLVPGSGHAATGTSTPCTACSVTPSEAVAPSTALEAPRHVAYRLTASLSAFVAETDAMPLASRAPPSPL